MMLHQRTVFQMKSITDSDDSTHQQQCNEHTVEHLCCLSLSRVTHAHQPIACTTMSARNPTMDNAWQLASTLSPFNKAPNNPLTFTSAMTTA